MPKQASDATKLRHANATIRELRDTLAKCAKDREFYRARATQAEQAVREWKDRFDVLLNQIGAALAKEGKSE